jgi:ADP-ribosyl-[dinitrogen reductase] hydrolase
VLFEEPPVRKPLAIFDMDGTVRDTFNCLYPRAHQIGISPGIPERLQELKRLGFILVGATNQGGVSKGEISEEEVRAANDRTQELLGDARFDRIYYCPHYAPADGRYCDCKKPAPGLVIGALTDFEDSTLVGSFVVGDSSDKDGGLALSLGLPFLHAHSFRSMPLADIGQFVGRPGRREAFVIPPAQKVLGTLVGLAVADALGAPLEFMSREEVRRKYPNGLDNLIASGTWEKGEYTDDTAMALMIALAYRDGGLARVPDLFKRWANNPGLHLPHGPKIACKDVGTCTRAVLEMGGDCKAAQQYYSRYPTGAAGNGALMRCAPVALYNINSLPMLIADSRRSARITHADPKAQSSCVILNAWIRSMIRDGVRDAREHAIGLLPHTERAVWERLRSIEKCRESEINSGGYTVDTLEAAAWSFLTTASFKEAVVRAANLGNDADTVAAVTGSLAGAFYGLDAIPGEWRQELKDVEFIQLLALEITLDGLREYAPDAHAIQSGPAHPAASSVAATT